MAVTPCSTRAHESASAAVAITWREVEPDDGPPLFHIAEAETQLMRAASSAPADGKRADQELPDL